MANVCAVPKNKTHHYNNMTTEEVKQLIKEALGEAIPALLQDVQTYADSIVTPKEEAVAGEGLESPDNNPLTSRVAELERQLALAQTQRLEEARQRELLSLRNQLGEKLTSEQLNNPVAIELLYNRLQGNVKSTEQGFLTGDGKNLDEYIKGFAESEEAALFRPKASGVKVPSSEVSVEKPKPSVSELVRDFLTF